MWHRSIPSTRDTIATTKRPVRIIVRYYWRDLPQVSFLSRPRFCHEKKLFVASKYFCRVKIFVTTNICRDKHNFVATKAWLSRQNFCRNIMFVATKGLSRQAYFFRDKRHTLSCQTRVCRDKTFVTTKMILVAASASDSLLSGMSEQTTISDSIPDRLRHNLSGVSGFI